MLTQAELHSILEYNFETGLFVLRRKIASKVVVGTRAGRIAKGYRYIGLYGKTYLEHRLAWFYVTGDWPYHIDHINRNTSDNRLCNLRPASKSENGMNMTTPKDNKSGAKGIIYYKLPSGKSGYQGRVGLNKEYTTKRFLITKDKPKEVAFEEAYNWVRQQRELLHKEFARHA